MAAQKGIYLYPVKTVSEARTVTEPEFQPDLFDKNDLYVNLDDIRDTTYLDDLYFDLGYNVKSKEFEPCVADYIKIIFSGHRGCGKSAELRRINNLLKHQERYFVVFIDLEQEVEVSSFEYEDFFSLLMHKLIEELSDAGVNKAAGKLKELSKRLFEKKEIERKTKNSAKTDGEAHAHAGFSLFGWGGKASFKQAFSGENEISTTVRREIKRNTLGIINEFNVSLVDIRADIQNNEKGKDLLFIIDGSEKIKGDVYEDLFIKNASIISEINVNILTAVPISANYQIEKAPYKFTNRYTVPMLKLEKYPNAGEKMKEIIGNRMDLSMFIEGDALDKCIGYSGGCIRQLFQVVHTSLRKSLGTKINNGHVNKAVKELGQDLWEYLDTKHLEVLKSGNYRPADELVSELLYMLILLKYNGTIEINPLLKDYPDFVAWKNN